MKNLFILFLLVVIAVALTGVWLSRDGQLSTPVGAGTTTLDAGEFESFPLPAYAAAHLEMPFQSYFVEVAPGIKVHVLEAGTGYPVYLQHGNPTSGFLYRKVAQALPLDRVRVIMPTMVGLGFSSKVPASQHTLDNHVAWMAEVLDQLGLEEAVYVGQDWGGPVGMGALALRPGVLQGAVVMNTGFNAPTEAADLSPAHARVKTPVVGELLLEGLVSIFDQLHNMQGDAGSISADVAELYGKPVRDSGNSKAPLALMRMVPDGPDHPSAERMRFIEQYVAGLEVPVELVWGMKDPILASGLPAMRANFPDAPVIETRGGHFLQEEVPEVIAGAIMRLVEEIEAPPASDRVLFSYVLEARHAQDDVTTSEFGFLVDFDRRATADIGGTARLEMHAQDEGDVVNAHLTLHGYVDGEATPVGETRIRVPFGGRETVSWPGQPAYTLTIAAKRQPPPADDSTRI